MPVGEWKQLFRGETSALRSTDYVELGDGNAVILEAWPTATGLATIEVVDSADPVNGYSLALAPQATQSGVTSRIKVLVPSLLPYVKVRLTPSSGAWNVRVVPVVAAGDTVTGRAVASPAALTNRVEALHAVASIAYAAPLLPSYKHVFGGVGFAYDGAPAAGSVVTVTDGVLGVVHRFPVTAAGPGTYLFPDESSSPGATLTVSLSDGGAGVTGYLEVLGKRVET